LVAPSAASTVFCRIVEKPSSSRSAASAPTFTDTDRRTSATTWLAMVEPR
jgi:hypothetical protein